MLRPKKNSYKESDNEKKFLRLKNSPPPPHNFSNGPSLNLVHKQRKKKRCWHVYVYILATKWEGRERVVFIFTKTE